MVLSIFKSAINAPSTKTLARCYQEVIGEIFNFPTVILPGLKIIEEMTVIYMEYGMLQF